MNFRELKIVGWAAWDEDKYPDVKYETVEQWEFVLDLISEELKKKGYKWHGEYHQNGEAGAPVFNDGTQFSTSFRGWGRIMAMAYPEEFHEADGCKYGKYAWYDPEVEYKYPNKEDILS